MVAIELEGSEYEYFSHYDHLAIFLKKQNITVNGCHFDLKTLLFSRKKIIKNAESRLLRAGFLHYCNYVNRIISNYKALVSVFVICKCVVNR